MICFVSASHGCVSPCLPRAFIFRKIITNIICILGIYTAYINLLANNLISVVFMQIGEFWLAKNLF